MKENKKGLIVETKSGEKLLCDSSTLKIIGYKD